MIVYTCSWAPNNKCTVHIHVLMQFSRFMFTSHCCDMYCFTFSLSVFYRQHRQIRDVIKLIVLQMVFNSHHLETYITRKISQFSSSTRVVDSITNALNSPEVERIIEERLDTLYVQPEGQYLEALGLSKVRLRPLIKPAVLSLCAESAPLVLDDVTERKINQVYIYIEVK